MGVLLIAEEPIPGSSTLTPIVYCKNTESVEKYLNETFQKIINTEDNKLTIKYYDVMPALDSLNLGHFWLVTPVDHKDGTRKTYDLYQCSNKEYGWVRSDIRKRVKKLKGFVVYQIPKVKFTVKDMNVKVEYTWICNVKQYLASIRSAVGVEAKTMITFELFEYLFHHRQEALVDRKFAEIVKSKLIELYNDHKIPQFQDFYEKIFEQPFPSSSLETVLS